MDRSDYSDADYQQPHVPPATPPVIDSHASAADAATLADDDGDSDAPGSQPSQLDRTAEDAQIRAGDGDRIRPDQQPDEIRPGQGDTDQPGRTPDEVAPGQGDFDSPDSAPLEMPPQPDTAPAETPPPD